MGKTATVKRIQQLCCLGLPGKAVAPVLLRELREVVPCYSSIFFWIDEKSQFCDLYSEDPDLYGLLPACFGEFHDEILQGIMRNIHCHNIAYTRICDHGRPVGLLAQGLESGKPRLTPPEERIMAKLSPYIAHALCAGGCTEGGESEDEETGLLVFDSSGRLHHASRKGRELLFFATHQIIAAGKCDDIPIPPELKNLCHGLAEIFGKTPGEPPVWRKKNDWGCFTFRAHRLERGFGTGGEMVGITVHKLIPTRLRLWDRIGKLGLPPRQSEACLHLACGMQQSDIAQRMGITSHAVNWHVREIYSRLDVHSAAELRVRLLA